MSQKGSRRLPAADSSALVWLLPLSALVHSDILVSSRAALKSFCQNESNCPSSRQQRYRGRPVPTPLKVGQQYSHTYANFGAA